VVAAPDDVIVSPTYLPDLVNSCLDLLIDGETGLWHLANAGGLSWYELAIRVARRAGFGEGLLRAGSSNGAQASARRPRFSVLGSERGELLPGLDDALTRYFAHRVPFERMEISEGCSR
jgi:dTDP-4-dehydrorhamnose reductase